MSGVQSTTTWPPSPLEVSNQVFELTDLRSVPLSCVPPQKRSDSAPGATCGATPIELNCAIRSPLRETTALFGATTPFRLCQSFAFSGSVVPPGRPPRCVLNQTPPSEPRRTWLVSVGSNASAWKSGCWS